MLKRIVTTVAALASAAALQAAVPAAASADAYGCAGSLVGSWRVPSKDVLTGRTYYVSDVKLYYDAGTGWNCAVLAKRPSTPRYGLRTPMYIRMENSRYAEDNAKDNIDEDGGDFKYYAGPVRVYGKNLCIGIFALFDDAESNGETPRYNSRLDLGPVACG
jgi:hypothetical protein